jgi:hypothetical protein
MATTLNFEDQELEDIFNALHNNDLALQTLLAEADTTVKELHDDHATFKATVDGLVTLTNELHDDHSNFDTAVTNLADMSKSSCLTTAGLVIKAGGSAVVKTGAAVTYALASGVIRAIAAATDMPALVGTTANGQFAIYGFYIDDGGVVTGSKGSDGATLDAAGIPPTPAGEALIGYLIINPTGTGDFVGGTTVLDDATVVPNAAYVDVTNSFNPMAVNGPGTITAGKASAGPATLTATKPSATVALGTTLGT